jgi:hypothetical protein
MNNYAFFKFPSRTSRIAIVFLLTLWPARYLLMAQASPVASLFSPEQLDRLVAPIAVYPESLLAQVFLAATHPLQVLEAQQWLHQNPRLQGLALVNAAQRQNWDTSVQVLLLFPDVLGPLASNIGWTSKLGNAFLRQRDEVIGAVERVRAHVQTPGRSSSS